MTSKQTKAAAGIPEQSIDHAAAPRGQALQGERSDTFEHSPTAQAVSAGASAFARPAATIETVRDEFGLHKGPLESGAHTDDSRPKISGKGEPGVWVHVYDGNEVMGRVEVGANGEWSFSPTLPLKGGEHQLSVTHQYPSGELVVGTETYVIFVDKVAPDMPVVLGIVDDEGRITDPITHGSVTDDNLPTIEGKTEPFATIIIYDKDAEIDRVQADESGDWRYTPKTELADGLHILNFEAMDRSGNVSEDTRKIEFTVDARPEMIKIFGAEDNVGPVTDDLVSGGKTDDTKPKFFGNATAGGIVKIYEGDVVIGEVVAGVDGHWEYTPTEAMSEGLHTLHATVTLPAKGESPPSKPFNLTVDATPPAKPSIDEMRDNVGDVQNPLASGQTTDDTTPTLVGKADAGSTVHIYKDGVLLDSVVADAAGTWTYTPATPLLPGDHSFTVTSQDAVGNVSAPSDAFAIEIDLEAPSQASGLVVSDDVGEKRDPLSNGDTTDDNKPTFSGKAEPGSTVKVYVDGDLLGSAPVDAKGDWSFTPDTALADDTYTFTTEVVDAAGNSSGKGNAITVTVDTSGVTVSIVELRDDQGSVTTNIVPNGETDDTRPQIVGTGKPGSTITVYDGDDVLGTAEVEADGSWRFTPTADLAQGLHTISATATDKTGTVSERTPVFSFTVDTEAPNTPSIELVEDNVGDKQDPLVNGGVTDDPTPTLSGKAEAGSTVTIRDNGQVVDTVVANEAGEWTYTPATPLTEDEHTFTVTATDKAGNTSAASPEFKLTTDYTPPAKPVIDAVHDDEGARTGDLTPGDSTDDATPKISGTAEKGSTVVIRDGANELGRVTADAEGKWTLELTSPLSSGGHSLTVEAIDAAGNKSEPSDAFDFSVDLVPPTTPVIVGVEDDVGEGISFAGVIRPGGTTNDNKPLITGTGKAGETIEIRLDGDAVGTAVVAADGWWSFQVKTAVLDGPRTFSAVAVSAGGAESALSNTYLVKVDTVAPDRPIVVSVHDNAGPTTGERCVAGERHIRAGQAGAGNHPAPERHRQRTGRQDPVVRREGSTDRGTDDPWRRHRVPCQHFQLHPGG
ncbi:Ig-like domain-containing protein [Acidovorax cavernicola]|uniref:Bacterial Ig-like domain-containing protein n=1 Tax=Acidovorax cavernicola TaxID=1675792 RepID=A0A9X8D835_9BURK|nr:Ig-like domain-containing protein [Acidovorax cavernicola]RIX84090.1 hypothetical protein D3H34_05085 [Acidovorax cavernicola]